MQRGSVNIVIKESLWGRIQFASKAKEKCSEFNLFGSVLRELLLRIQALRQIAMPGVEF